jgi:hypothetical protein
MPIGNISSSTECGDREIALFISRVRTWQQIAFKRMVHPGEISDAA